MRYLKKVILTTGGTGGHIYPALSVAEGLRKKGVDVLFVGTSLRMEKDIVPKFGFKFVGLNIAPPRTLKNIFGYIRGVLQGVALVFKEKPDAIIGFGNYISIPVLVGGVLSGKKIYLQEQNANLGGTNKLFYWATGEKNYDEIVKNINRTKIQDTVRPYFENMINIMAAADLVVCRAGALTISEIIQLGKPSVIIPYNSIKVGQYANGKLLEEVGAALMYKNSEATLAIEKAFELLENKNELDLMKINIRNLKKENAVEKIIESLDIWRN